MAGMPGAPRRKAAHGSLKCPRKCPSLLGTRVKPKGNIEKQGILPPQPFSFLDRFLGAVALKGPRMPPEMPLFGCGGCSLQNTQRASLTR